MDWMTTHMFGQARNGQENLKREINCLKRLKHVNIIQLYDVIDEEQYEKVYLVFELANYSSVRE
jgi:serine/threonine protein kinase